MDVYTTEEEQVENIKKWWKENGRSVITGVVLGLGGVLGWQGWTAHKSDVAGQASIQFEQLAQSVAAGQDASAAKQAELLQSDFESTPYALFAALTNARVKLKQDDVAAARASLEWVVKDAGDLGLQEIARYRLVRILLSEKQLDAAAALIAEAKVKSFAGDYAELEGDIAVARDDLETAAEAYRRALDNNVGDPALVQMKLGDLTRDEKTASNS